MILISILKNLDETWFTPEQEKELTDEQVLEVIYEDVGLFLEGAQVRVFRSE